MAEMSRGKKTVIIVAASVVGVILIGSASAALAVGAVFHLKDERGFMRGKSGYGDEGCEGRGGCDENSGATPASTGRESDGYFDEVVDGLAFTLGLSAAELEDELAGGKKIMDIAGERGVSLDALVDSVNRVAGEIIDQELADGDLSLEMADYIKAEVADYAAWSLEHGGAWLQREHAWRH